MQFKCTASWQQVVVMEFGERHYITVTDATDFCPCQLIVSDLLLGNWCNGFWRYRVSGRHRIDTAIQAE